MELISGRRGGGPGPLSAPTLAEQWYIHGTQGQVRGRAMGSTAASPGAVHNAYGYNAWGQTAYNSDVDGASTGILPAYLDGDSRVMPERPDTLPGWKHGAGVSARDPQTAASVW